MADKSLCNCFSGCTALSPDSFHAQESGEQLKALQPFFFQLFLGTQRTFKDPRPAWENNRIRKYSTSSKATEPKKVKSWGLCLYGDISWLFTGSSKQSLMNTVGPVNTISTGFNSELRKKNSQGACLFFIRSHLLSHTYYNLLSWDLSTLINRKHCVQAFFLPRAGQWLLQNIDCQHLQMLKLNDQS